jgi:hypothetical protein
MPSGPFFCVGLQVTNVGTAPTTNWTAVVNTNQSTIFDDFARAVDGYLA